VKHLLDQPDSVKYSLEGLAAMAGFGSRITFARAFQKFVGCTPGEYVKRRKTVDFSNE
jgi:AraC-like DNA-binding protein